MVCRKILVTGGSGFLGRRILEYYRDNYLVIAPEHGKMDITDKEQVMKVFVEERPDVVIHCAAVSAVGACEKDPQGSWDINVRGSETIAWAAQKTDAKCLLCSSDQVYFGNRKRDAHVEEENLCPANTYGKEKLYAEESCLRINPDCVLLRLTWMYAAPYANPEGHRDFMWTLFENLRQGEKFSYPVYDFRGITCVQEVVKNLEKAWNLPGGVYNFGSENDGSVYETAFSLLERAGQNTSKLIKNSDAFCDAPRNLSMNIDKIRKYGIDFPSTIEGLVQNFEQSVHLLSV